MNQLLTNFAQQFGLSPLDSGGSTIFIMVHGADGSIASFYELARKLHFPLLV